MLTQLNPLIRYADNLDSIDFKSEIGEDHCRLFFVLEGECNVKLGKKSVRMGADSVLYLPPHTPYSFVSVPEDSTVFCVFFDLYTDGASANGTTTPLDRVIFLPRGEMLRALLLDATETLMRPDEYSADHAHAIFKRVLLILDERSRYAGGRSALTEHIIDYVRENYARQVTNQEIAACFGYHPYHISRVMREETGLTLKTYIINYRLGVSCHLLTYTDLSIADIARKSGFDSQSYYSKMFREEYGMTPGEYRKNNTRR